MFISRHFKNEETANEIIRRLDLKKGNNLYTCVGGFQIAFDNKEELERLFKDYVELLEEKMNRESEEN